MAASVRVWISEKEGSEEDEGVGAGVRERVEEAADNVDVD